MQRRVGCCAHCRLYEQLRMQQVQEKAFRQGEYGNEHTKVVYMLMQCSNCSVIIAMETHCRALSASAEPTWNLGADCHIEHRLCHQS